MKKIIIIIAIVLLVLSGYWFLSTDKIVLDDSETIAREWIMNYSPTYTFDGSDLELIDREGNTFTFEFVSRYGGYGDRTNQIVTQVITPHKMIVVVENGVVVDALTDGVFSETQNKIINLEKISNEELITLPVFFGRMGEEIELFPISRMISKENDLATALFESLIAGPTKSETEIGFYSMINPETKLQFVRTEGRTIYVDFSNELQEGIAGSASVLFIRSQIEKTGRQIPGITEVVISIEGETEEILQP